VGSSRSVRLQSGTLLLVMLLWCVTACAPAAAPPAATTAPAAKPTEAAKPTTAPAAASSPAAGAASPAAAAASPAASPASPGASPAASSASPASSPAASPAAAASSAPAAAAAAKPATAPPTGTPIKVGVLDDITGVSAIEGALMRISVELVVDQTNSSGGINGHPLQVVYVDPKGDAAQALQLATQLAQSDNVDVLSGGIFSPECLGVQGLAEKLGLVYVALNGCANEQFTVQSCNKYSFRVFPVGRQLDEPMVAYEIKSFGDKWGIIYPDYVLGQSNVASISAALKKNGTDFVESAKIAVPLNEPNMTPYVSKIPTDGSIQVLQVSQTGSDLARVMAVIQQFGINSKVKIITALGKESFAGVYPDAMNGAIIRGFRPSDGLPGNADDAAFAKAWTDMAKKLGDISGPLGGGDKATPGNNNGYIAYASMKALVLAMRAANFTGKADTDKLIASFETLNVPQGPDFPGGPLVMNTADHQGKMTQYLLQVNGQKEDVLATFPADQLANLGDCQAK
jgi:ABC-type branched-subunit amino acid transport system substrate-binding protein